MTNPIVVFGILIGLIIGFSIPWIIFFHEIKRVSYYGLSILPTIILSIILGLIGGIIGYFIGKRF